MKKIKNWFEKIVIQIIEKGFQEQQRYLGLRAKEEAIHGIFSFIGIDRLKKLIETAEKQGNVYINLSELYSQTLRENLSKENSEIIHSYFELVPKLDEYKKKIDSIIKE